MSRKLRNKPPKKSRVNNDPVDGISTRAEFNIWADKVYHEGLKMPLDPYKVANVCPAFSCSMSDILKRMQQRGEYTQAAVGEGKLNTRARNTHVWAYEDEEILRGVRLMFSEANADYFRINITDVQTPQLCVYYADAGDGTGGGHYSWHPDQKRPWPLQCKQSRKLSASILLTPKSQFDGGDLEIFVGLKANGRPHVVRPKLEKPGDAVIFTSDTWHRVTPVTRGTRATLVTWCMGDSFGSDFMDK